MSNYAYREFSTSGTDKGDSCTMYRRRIKTNILSFVKVSIVCLYSKMRFLMIYSIQIMNFINRRLCHDRYNQAETTGSSVTITFSK